MSISEEETITSRRFRVECINGIDEYHDCSVDLGARARCIVINLRFRITCTDFAGEEYKDCAARMGVRARCLIID